MRMNISVPDALAEEVRRRDLPISAICQAALRTEVRNAQVVETTVDIRIVSADATSNPDHHAWPHFDPNMPYLTYGPHPHHGQGWTLWYDLGSRPGDNPDDYFIPGDPGDVVQALESARLQMRRARENSESITVEVGELPVKMGFKGRWLVKPDPDRTRTGEEGHDAGVYWGVALTRRGRIAVTTAHRNDQRPSALHDYDTLNAAVQDGLPADIAAAAAGEMGEEFILWRDI